MRRRGSPPSCKERPLLSTSLDVDLPMASPDPTERWPQTIRLVRVPPPAGVGVLSITKNRRTTHYTFQEIRCDIGGRGFAVHRLGLGSVYHVRVGQPRDCTCDCLGFLQHGHCKHVLGLQALIGHGLL
jgi:hypothetical protein